jgi:OOP family OmpA-OmpF porin
MTSPTLQPEAGDTVLPLMRLCAALTLSLAALLAPASLRAQGVALRGWSLDRHDPSPAGDVFFVAEHPWYSSARVVAAGAVLTHALTPLALTRDYADGTTRRDAIVAGMLVAHTLVAASAFDRVALHLDLPLSLHQSGVADPTQSSRLAPADGANVGDLRVGTRVRLFGHADRDRFSLHLGVGVAVPTGNRDVNTGDGTTRVEPRVIAAGRASSVRWSASLAWMSRPSIDGGGVVVGDELRAKLGVGLALTDERLHVGLEAALFTTVRELPRSLGEGNAAFTRGAWGMELLLGARYTFLRALAVGAAAGVGMEQAAGTPTARMIVSVQYAPLSPRRELR